MDKQDTCSKHFPRTLYVALWFPLASETFVFYEVDKFYKQNMPVSVITLYGDKPKNLAEHIRNSPVPIERFGIPATGRILAAAWRSFKKNPEKTKHILRNIFLRRWRDLEMRLEAAWAGVSGFYLAERCKAMGIEHIHTPWANGPATAAWVVNYLEDIPFSFTARAGDVRPPDGFLKEKLEACAFARSESSYQIPLMASFLPEKDHEKLYITYNVRTLSASGQAKVTMQKPYKILCIGRLVETKGFQYLIEALRMLVDAGQDVQLTIAGDGAWMGKLKRQIASLKLENHVHMLGFVTHDNILEHILASDIFSMPSVVKKNVDDCDGLPNVVIEAMSYGLPVVATDVAGMSDVLKDGETGYLVPQRDAKALYLALNKMIADPENARRMAHNAKDLMNTMFDSEANLERVRQLFCKYTPKKEL